MTAHDGWDSLRGGFRADWTPAGANSLTLQGDVYRTRFDETLTTASLSAPYSNTFPNDGQYTGGNILGRWNHTSERSSMSLQMYYDNTTISDHSLFGDHQNILDIDFQHGFHVGDSQQFVWGLGYRSIHDKNNPSFTVSLQPNQVTLNQFSTFLQDEISLVDNRLQITLGSKFERNEFTGFEIEPNARLLWNLTPNQSIWTAVSRAVRTPALTEEGLRLNSQVIPPGTPANPTPFPAVVAVFGSHQFNSEDLLAYELGYRVQVTSTLSLDVATFYNNYSNLRTAEPFAFRRRESRSDRYRHPLCRGKQDERRNLRRGIVCRLESRSEVEAGRLLQLFADGHTQERRQSRSNSRSSERLEPASSMVFEIFSRLAQAFRARHDASICGPASQPECA